MADSSDDLKAIIEKLSADVSSLTERVEMLEKAGRAGTANVEAPQGITEQVQPSAVSGVEKESALSVGGVAALMSRGTVISLILLFALVLRTLTDGGTLNMMVGTALGIGYATIIEGMGWLMYRRNNSFAPIFSTSGALLLAAVVLETHAGFGSISSLPAYFFLAVAGGGMAIISRQYKAAIPVCVGTLAVFLAAVSLDFPETDYFVLSIFLIAVNIMAFTAVNMKRARWLRIVVYTLTTLVLLAWGYKLRFTLLSGNGLEPDSLIAGPAHYYSVVALYVLFYMGAAVLGIWRIGSGEKRPFDHLLPSFTVAWTYLACLMVANASGADLRVLGLAGVGAASGLLGLAAIKGSRKGTSSRGTTTFAFPAALLLALSFREVSGQSAVALAILSWGALSLAWLSNRWTSAGVRVTGYFLQASVLGAALILLLMSPTGGAPLFTVLSMAVTSGVAFIHYRLTRNLAPPGQNPYFTRFDKSDVSGVTPLLVSVGAAFLAVRGLLYVLTTGSELIFQAGESITINIGALLLFLGARIRQNAEVKWVAVLVTILGAGKVFLYDLFKVKGMPIVLSVLSFVFAAAVGSWVLGKWQVVKNEQV